MPNPQRQTAEPEIPVAVDQDDGDQTADEIGRQLASLWQRFSGRRPKSTSVELNDNVVKCVIEESAPQAASDEDGEQVGDPALSPDSASFQHNASAAVTRVTHRKVRGFIPKHDRKNEVLTQTFVLERPPRRY
jgi:hypothetical protein